MKKILTFDCYGTLLDTKPLYNFVSDIARMNGIQEERAVEVFSGYEDRLMYGETFRTYDRLLFEVLTYCDMELNTNVFSAKYEDIIELHKTLMPFPDVMQVLHALKEKGYELAIMSNTTKQMMEWHLEKLDHVFDNSLVAEETGCYKPDLKFFEMAEQKFDIGKKNHYHIAKGYWWDIVPARKMGWNKIWVNRTQLLNGRDSEKPYATIMSLSELMSIL